MSREIYLDNSATTRQYDEVTELIWDISKNTYGNPSSLHTMGIEAEKLVNSAREAIAATLSAEPKEIYFTSGGTESNNLAIRGYLNGNPRAGKHLITTKTEHPSVLEVFRHLEESGYSVDYISVDKEGALDLDELKGKINPETALISIILVNNETGAIQDINEISAIRDRINPKTVIHVDAVQAYGKIPFAPGKSGIGLLSMSSHKIHGPKGVGAVYVSRNLRIKPLFFGGGQESLLRSGTENVPGIAGFGLAARKKFENIEENFKQVLTLRDYFIEKLSESNIDHRVISPGSGSPYILNIAFEGVKAEVLLHHLEQDGIFVSTGSACSSRKKIRSHVLSAMGISNNLIDGAIRFSFSSFNTINEIDETVKSIERIIPVIDTRRTHRSGRIR